MTFPAGSWLHEFRVFGPLHAASVAGAGAIIAGAVVAGRCWRGTPREPKLRRTLAAFSLLWQGFAGVWYLHPANFDPRYSFPLQLCDITACLAGLSLIHPARWARSLVYFWGFALCTQAFLTPIVTVGPAHLRFWFFWVGHSIILGTGVYDLAVRGFRPTARDLAVGVMSALAYAAAIIPFNLLTGLSYGFLGRATPATPSLLDRLGPWPWRPAWVILLAIGAMVLLWVPWLGADRRRHLRE